MKQLSCHSNVSNNQFLSGLNEALGMVRQIDATQDDDIVIDFAEVRFVSPLFVLPLMVYLHRMDKRVKCVNLSSYLKAVHFGDGLRPDEMRELEFKAHLESFARNTYVPVINFPTTARNDEKDLFISTVESIISRQLNLSGNILVGLKYLIGESVDNITEHSESTRGYIFAQAYKKLGFLDVCIADNGITLLGSYQKQHDSGIESDLEAMQAANRGISTKNRPDAENRGFGIRTSKSMLINGLGGHFVMLSGSALHIRNQHVDNYLAMPGVRWNGTVVAMRIPYNNSHFLHTNYLE